MQSLPGVPLAIPRRLGVLPLPVVKGRLSRVQGIVLPLPTMNVLDIGLREDNDKIMDVPYVP